MTESERREKERKLIESLRSPAGVEIQRGNSVFNTKDNATECCSFGDMKAAFVYLYILFHHGKLHAPEFLVTNPNASAPVGDYILPHDLYLRDEQEQMEAMDFDEFVDFCEQLVVERKVPVLGVCGGADSRDLVRFSAQVLFHRFPEDAQLPDIILVSSVSGGTAGKNQKVMEEIKRNMFD